jgi:hypothetical protein
VKNSAVYQAIQGRAANVWKMIVPLEGHHMFCNHRAAKQALGHLPSRHPAAILWMAQPENQCNCKLSEK